MIAREPYPPAPVLSPISQPCGKDARKSLSATLSSRMQVSSFRRSSGARTGVLRHISISTAKGVSCFVHSSPPSWLFRKANGTANASCPLARNRRFTLHNVACLSRARRIIPLQTCTKYKFLYKFIVLPAVLRNYPRKVCRVNRYSSPIPLFLTIHGP